MPEYEAEEPDDETVVWDCDRVYNFGDFDVYD